ncbi:MAG: glycosyltransferase, partial [archaeon]
LFPLSWGIDGLIYVSENDKKMFTSPVRSVVIPNGVESEYFDSSLGKRKKDSFVFLGRFSQNKRVKNLIDAFAIFSKTTPSATLTIAGPDWDETKKELDAYVQEKNGVGKVSILNEISEKEKLLLLQKSSVFVSASEYEGFGISVIEGMAAGCIPCVNTIPTFEKFVNEGGGFLTDYADTLSVVAAWTRILSMKPAESLKMRKRVRAYAHQFAWSEVVRKQVDFYYSIVGKTP